MTISTAGAVYAQEAPPAEDLGQPPADASQSAPDAHKPVVMTPPPAPSPAEIEVRFLPGAWLTRVNGDARLGPSPVATDIRMEEAFDLDSYEAIFNGELSVTKNNFWDLKFSGFDFSADSTGTFADSAVFGSLLLDPGDTYLASFEMTSIAAELCAWIWQPYSAGPLTEGAASRVGLRAGPFGGVRWLDIDHTVEILGEGTAVAQGEWMVPYAGFKFELGFNMQDSVPLLDSIVLEAGGALGPALGGDNGFMTQLHAGLTGQFTPNFGAGIGYRLIQVDVGYDDFDFNGGLQGLFLFASLQF